MIACIFSGQLDNTSVRGYGGVNLLCRVGETRIIRVIGALFKMLAFMNVVPHLLASFALYADDRIVAIWLASIQATEADALFIFFLHKSN